MGSDIGRAVGVPDAFNAALSSPMKENCIFAAAHVSAVFVYSPDREP